jgi:hypothetical protein
VPISQGNPSGPVGNVGRAPSPYSTEDTTQAASDERRLSGTVERQGAAVARPSCPPITSSRLLGRQPFQFATSTESIVSELSSILGSPGERYLHEERKIDLWPIGDLVASPHAIGWHPSVLFYQLGHPLHGQRLGCIVGVMTDPITGKPTGLYRAHTSTDTTARSVRQSRWEGAAASLGFLQTRTSSKA